MSKLLLYAIAIGCVTSASYIAIEAYQSPRAPMVLPAKAEEPAPVAVPIPAVTSEPIKDVPSPIASTEPYGPPAPAVPLPKPRPTKAPHAKPVAKAKPKLSNDRFFLDR